MTNHTFKTGVSRISRAFFLRVSKTMWIGTIRFVRSKAFVDALDLEKLKFRHGGSVGGAGQPPYDPGDLLKLYLYGYINRIRSSRSLEREAGRNLELIWLMKRLAPGYRPLPSSARTTGPTEGRRTGNLCLWRESSTWWAVQLVAIDGAFFDGNASKASIKTRSKLAKRLAEIDREIEAYGPRWRPTTARRQSVRRRDGNGDGAAGTSRNSRGGLMAKRAKLQTDLAQLERARTSMSRTDADARFVVENGQVVGGLQCPDRRDDKHKLIVARRSSNDGQRYRPSFIRWPKAAKDEPVPGPDGTGRHRLLQRQRAQGLRGRRDRLLTFASQADRKARSARPHEPRTVRLRSRRQCLSLSRRQGPEPTKGRKPNGGRIEIRYVSRKSDCDACALRSRGRSPPDADAHRLPLGARSRP